MDYIGENLLPGQIGHFLIVLSFVASIVATLSYYMSVKTAQLGQGTVLAFTNPDSVAWKKLARYSFIIQFLSIVTIFALLFYMVFNHMFEYHYVWKHSSRSLEMKYLLACIWEGQEGSTLLWTFWHSVLGLVLIRKGKEWEAPVMTVISFTQVLLAAMLLGVYVFGYRLGINPFLLLRDSGVLDNAPALHMNFDATQPLKQDFMLSIKDGNDLNPLLQNYWMVIHPPVLFLGFASTLVPFAFALSGLWFKKKDQWINASLPWTLFSVAIFGIGIMMGAAWAYESLNFGGYWAWDPVENASLVPWLILVAGLHTLLIYKHSGFSLRTTYLFFLLGFIFVWYSTFLTKSGILGETSVHAFTDTGLNVQLFLSIYVFVWMAPIAAAKTFNEKIMLALAGTILGLGAYFLSVPGLPMFAILGGVIAMVVYINKLIPTVKREEDVSSREFWMFIGSLVFFLSALVITVITSLPVFNSLFDLKQAQPENVEFLYNQIHVLVAVVIAFLTAIGQYLKYKKTSRAFLFKKIGVPTIIAAVIATLVLAFGDINYTKEGMGFLIQIWIATAASIFAIVANAAYLWVGIKGNMKMSGGSIAHVGFGMVLLGILLSSGKKEILSYNTSGIHIDFGTDSTQKSGENLTLVKGVAMQMGGYDVTYIGDSAHPKKSLNYFLIDFKNKKSGEEFRLTPNSFINYKNNEGLMSNPSSRHYLTHDVFTYISAMADPEKNKDTARFVDYNRAIGDTIFYSKGYILVENVVATNNLPMANVSKDDSAILATLNIHAQTGSRYTTDLLLLKDTKGNIRSNQDTLMAESLVMELRNWQNGKATIGVKESNSVLEWITLKAYKFPFINILWAGIILTAIGLFISMFYRISQNKRNKLQKVA